jgi:flagellar basal body rod protein FlgG
MTMPAILNSARSLTYYTRLQAMTANNLANASTEGFKADRMTAHAGVDGSPVPVQSLDLSQGTIRDTGRTLDVALDGKGFLVVQTPQGDRLSRGGSLSLDGKGLLVDRQGNPVLGKDGPIHVAGRTVEIGQDGTVMVDGARTGALQIMNAVDPNSLQKTGQGLFVPDIITPATGVTVHQGALEEANVNPLLGMVDMLSIQRAFSANTDALKVMDGVLGTVTGDIGKP